MPKLRACVSLVGILLVAAGPVACAPEADATGEDAEVSEAELGADDDLQSFETYDATDDELAKAQPAAPSANELTLYAIPAPKLTGLSWKRPGGLARRTLLGKALGLSRSIGHAGVHVRCAATATEPAGHFLGSVTDTDDTFRNMVLKEKAGLGVLLRTVPGTIEPEADLQKTVDERTENGRMAFIRFQIAPDVCQSLLGYSREFARLDVAKEYGFVRPLYKEGAGCSAFSMAFLELAGLDEARFRREWGFDVRIPMRLIGGKDNPGNKVSALELFFTFRPWAREDEPHRRLIGWDPTKMYTSIRTMAKEELRGADPRKVEKRGRALGLVLDRRNAQPRSELVKRTYWAGNAGAPRNYWGFGDP